MSDPQNRETESSLPTSPERGNVETAPAPRRGIGGWLLAVLLIAAAGVIWYQWDKREQSEQQVVAWQREAAALEQRLDEHAAALDSVRRTQKALETRAADNASTNRVLREELLGMGERAELLEDAVGRLADTRLRGEVMLRLNEVEFLLLLGQERLQLFGDVEATIRAYALADAVLAGIEDAVIASSRQTLAQELLALRAVPEDPRPQLRRQLAALGESLAALPVSREGEVKTVQSNDSRLVKLLSQLVTVRRVAERDTVLGSVQRETSLGALRLQLELAQAALARPDAVAYRDALGQVDALLLRLFDRLDPGVVAVREQLAALRQTVLAPELPVLGATLQELRGLRAARRASEIEPVAPPPAPALPDAPATDVDAGLMDSPAADETPPGRSEADE